MKETRLKWGDWLTMLTAVDKQMKGKGREVCQIWKQRCFHDCSKNLHGLIVEKGLAVSVGRRIWEQQVDNVLGEMKWQHVRKIFEKNILDFSKCIFQACLYINSSDQEMLIDPSLWLCPEFRVLPPPLPCRYLCSLCPSWAWHYGVCQALDYILPTLFIWVLSYFSSVLLSKKIYYWVISLHTSQDVGNVWNPMMEVKTLCQLRKRRYIF